ncbi:MAG: hypothetical protein R2822_17835 [Spirosomataceae bacterium]
MQHFDWVDYQLLVEKHIYTLNQVDLTKEQGYLVRFAVFSANLTNFLPHIPVSSHPDLFKQNLIHIALETLDRSIPQLSDFTVFEGDISLVSQPKQPVIFCTFHLGSYRNLASWLVKLGYHFSILVRKSVYDQQAAEILDHTRQIKAVYPSSSEVQVINAEEASSLLKILRQLRSGHSLLVYMDGNTGTSEDKGELIDFLQRPIFAKQGAAFLSYISGVPILPVVCYRRIDDHRNVIVVNPPIFPDKERSKKNFSLSTTQQLYNWFSTYLQLYPEQWEAWNYIHHQLSLSPESKPLLSKTAFQKPSYQFNSQRYSLFALQEEYILLDRFYYQTYEISHDLYDYLLQSPLQFPQRTLGKAIFRDLIIQSILI